MKFRLKDKNERIKVASQGVCPYTGNEFSEGDLDHIIPRSSQWGVLNDEANLIWASDQGNNIIKKEQIFSMANLHPNYKQKLFNTSDDAKITQWIENQIGNGEKFRFGQYRSFINLSLDEQKAFRHALFLKNHPLYEKVIRAIDNRSRTLVNGTQRYFAEVLANNLYKKAKAVGKRHLLSFDYFGVEAQSNTRGDGIYDLRNEYERIDNKLIEYAKDTEEKQKTYSHLVDATLAFAIAADAHKKDGGLKLEIDDSISLWPVDSETGEISENNIFNAIKVAPEEMKEHDLKRRKAYEIETHHRRLLNGNKLGQIQVSYKIHRDGLIGERFFPLIRCSDGTIKKGFHPNNSIDYKESNFNLLQPFLQKRQSNNQSYEVWVAKKKQAQEFLMEVGSCGGDGNEQKVAKLLDGLSYQTVKKSIQSVLNEKTVGDALQSWDCHIKENSFREDKILLPFFNQWMRLKTSLEHADQNLSLQDFLKDCDLFRHPQKQPHQKVKKVYSLPVVATIGNIRLRRRTWDQTTIIQTVPQESIAKYGYKSKSKDRPHTILSKNSVPKKHYTGIPPKWKIEPLKWIEVPLNEIEKKEGIEILCAQVILKDAGRCTACLTVSSIENLSLPQDKANWKGKIIQHDSGAKSSLEGGKIYDKKNDHHCLSSEGEWFPKPFSLPKDRSEVEMKTNSDGITVKFTIGKSKKIEEWLLTNNSNETLGHL